MLRLVAAVLAGLLLGALGAMALGADPWRDDRPPAPVIELEGRGITSTTPTTPVPPSSPVELVPPPTVSPDDNRGHGGPDDDREGDDDRDDDDGDDDRDDVGNDGDDD
ncbi:MAG TPA: hypothetical protein VFZ68_06325 [Acidimicrobiales bacterium]